MTPHPYTFALISILIIGIMLCLALAKGPDEP